MIDIERSLLQLMARAGGQTEVELSHTDDGGVLVRVIPTMARYAKKVGKGETIEDALLAVAERLQIELPTMASTDVCHMCGGELRPDEPFDGHRECREQE